MNSMTGFGAKGEVPGRHLSVEVRSFNHRVGGEAAAAVGPGRSTIRSALAGSGPQEGPSRQLGDHGRKAAKTATAITA